MLDRAYSDGIKRVEVITPERASSLLDANVGNRRLIAKHVASLASALAEGRWRFNGETIKIARDGRLLDGQHRLAACVKSGVSFETLIVYDLDRDVFDTIDTGRTRRAAAILGIEGCKHQNAVASAIRWIRGIPASRTAGSLEISPDEVRLEWIANPEIETSAGKTRAVRTLMSHGMAAALHFLFSKKDAALADRFFEALAFGVNLGPGDAIYVLRERLIKETTARRKLPPLELATLCVRAWNATRKGLISKTLKGVAVVDGKEVVPQIE